jgi:hypothetical protein
MSSSEPVGQQKPRRTESQVVGKGWAASASADKIRWDREVAPLIAAGRVPPGRRSCAAERGATRRSATSSTNAESYSPQRDEFHQCGELLAAARRVPPMRRVTRRSATSSTNAEELLAAARRVAECQISVAGPRTSTRLAAVTFCPPNRLFFRTYAGSRRYDGGFPVWKHCTPP